MRDSYNRSGAAAPSPEKDLPSYVLQTADGDYQVRLFLPKKEFLRQTKDGGCLSLVVESLAIDITLHDSDADLHSAAQRYGDVLTQPSTGREGTA